MPLDIVTPPISSSITRQDRWQAHLPHTDRTPAPSKASLFETSPATEISRAQTSPTGSSAAFLAQALAQADADKLRVYAPVPPAKAVSIVQRYEIAESRDPILRGESILFRVSA
jgi:hypothetical protein